MNRKAVVLEVGHRMAELFLEIAHDQEPHADAVADLNDSRLASVKSGNST